MPQGRPNNRVGKPNPEIVPTVMNTAEIALARSRNQRRLSLRPQVTGSNPKPVIAKADAVGRSAGNGETAWLPGSGSQ